jgi:hypothetical protein
VSWSDQTLSTLSALVADVRGVFTEYTTEQLDFLKVRRKKKLDQT